ncbi:MAG TPA: hypothetical protein VIM69_11985, partial [Opitutaceae bacterium]
MRKRIASWFAVFALVVGSVSSARSAKADTPELLNTAITKLVTADDQWAYTQIFRRTDRTGEDTVARFDPSKPANAHWELVKLHGRTPTKEESQKWCAKREQAGTQTDSRALVDLLDLPNAFVAEEDAKRVRFEIPLKKNTIARVPTENFVAFAEVDRHEQALQRFSIVLKQSIRLIGGMAEISTAQGDVFFKSFDDSDTTRPTYISASGSGQALFHHINRSAEVIYQDQR